MLIIRTNQDAITNYLFLWSAPIISLAESKGLQVNKLDGAEVTNKNIISRVNKNKPKIIFFNGHGSESGLFSKDAEVINLDSAEIFTNTITFARACHCLVKLGPKAVTLGCKSFIGYKKKFWLARNPKYECTPLKDTVAKPIIEASNAVVISLIKGNSVGEAIDSSHKYVEKAALNLIYSRDPYANASLWALVENDSALGFVGDESARIF